MSFLPPDFEPPVLETERFRLRSLKVHDVIKDYDAVMTSQSSQIAYHFFKCFLRKSMARAQAVLALAPWKLPRSSQWKPCCASG